MSTPDPVVAELVEDWTGKCDWFGPPECDCPMRHLHVDGVCLEIHYEPDRSVHILCDAGDWQDETSLLDAANIDEASTRALVWFREHHPPESALRSEHALPPVTNGERK